MTSINRPKVQTIKVLENVIKAPWSGGKGERWVHLRSTATRWICLFARSTPLCFVRCDVLFAILSAVLFYFRGVLSVHVRYGTATRMLCLSSAISLFLRIPRLFGWFRWFIYSPDDFLIATRWLYSRIYGRLRAILSYLLKLWMCLCLFEHPVISGDLNISKALFVNGAWFTDLFLLKLV